MTKQICGKPRSSDGQPCRRPPGCRINHKPQRNTKNVSSRVGVNSSWNTPRLSPKQQEAILQITESTIRGLETLAATHRPGDQKITREAFVAFHDPDDATRIFDEVNWDETPSPGIDVHHAATRRIRETPGIRDATHGLLDYASQYLKFGWRS